MLVSASEVLKVTYFVTYFCLGLLPESYPCIFTWYINSPKLESQKKQWDWDCKENLMDEMFPTTKVAPDILFKHLHQDAEKF